MLRHVKEAGYALLMLAEAGLDALLGPPCPVCGEHVFPKDRLQHSNREHPEAAA